MNSGGGVNELTIRIMNWVGIPNDGTLDPEKTYQLAGYYFIFFFYFIIISRIALK